MTKQASEILQVDDMFTLAYDEMSSVRERSRDESQFRSEVHQEKLRLARLLDANEEDAWLSGMQNLDTRLLQRKKSQELFVKEQLDLREAQKYRKTPSLFIANANEMDMLAEKEKTRSCNTTYRYSEA